MDNGHVSEILCYTIYMWLEKPKREYIILRGTTAVWCRNLLHQEKKDLEKEVRKVHTIHVNNVIHGRRRGGVGAK